jgi:hypothetical protein
MNYDYLSASAHGVATQKTNIEIYTAAGNLASHSNDLISAASKPLIVINDFKRKILSKSLSL